MPAVSLVPYFNSELFLQYNNSSNSLFSETEMFCNWGLGTGHFFLALQSLKGWQWYLFNLPWKIAQFADKFQQQDLEGSVRSHQNQSRASVDLRPELIGHCPNYSLVKGHKEFHFHVWDIIDLGPCGSLTIQGALLSWQWLFPSCAGDLKAKIVSAVLMVQ